MNTAPKTTIHMPGRTDIALAKFTPDQLATPMYDLPSHRGDYSVPLIDDLVQGAGYNSAMGFLDEGNQWGCTLREVIESLTAPDGNRDRRHNDADTLMRECLEREAKQRVEIAARSLNFHGSESTAI